MEALIAACEAAYDTDRNSSYLSHVRRAELEELRRLEGRLREAGPAALLEQLRAEEPALRQALQEELDHPSFDWYDGHYQYKVLEGVQDARRSVMKLLEGKLLEGKLP